MDSSTTQPVSNQSFPESFPKTFSEASNISPTDVAIIGMAGRFPGANNIDEFWHNLCHGIESIATFSDAELLESGIDPDLLAHPNYVKAGAVLDDIRGFDAGFFGFSPREAALIDPQHRLMLETAWAALEQAGYNPDTYSGRIGAFAGAGWSSYLFNNLRANPDCIDAIGEYQTLLSNDKDFLATRLAYKFNLKGPAYTVQTACSTSLVAVGLACQNLLNYQCDMALAGGVSAFVPHKAGYLYREGSILSPDGHCRAFDAKAEGTVIGNGVGVVVLKRLEDAIADRDFIYAVIKGAAINNDGSDKVGYTAPSVNGQAEAIVEALELAAVEPDTITYIETHGTGTTLGDPIEVAALTQVFRSKTQRRSFCAIGSVKTNIGHLDTAAGVAGLIKTTLALHHRQLPPSLHFEQPNPNIDFANSPFYVNTALTPWELPGIPCRAGVSSFGIGGTNAHVVLEEAPILPPSPVKTDAIAPGEQLLVLSAKTRSALDTATQNLANHLQSHSELDLADVAYTLQVGRKAFAHRRVLVCRDRKDAIHALMSLDGQRVLSSDALNGDTFQQEMESDRPIIFMFSGQGSQYVNMGRNLYETEPIFRNWIDRGCEFLQPILDTDLRNIIYPDQNHPENSSIALNQTVYAQPALFLVEYALAQVWMAWGIRPRAMIGHSIGEYVAACLAGVFSFEDVLMLVASRGQLMQSLPSGKMLSVSLSVDDMQPFLSSNLSLAVINSPSLCVVSGTEAAIASLITKLDHQGIAYRPLHTSHAFHSSMMEPILNAFQHQVSQVQRHVPTIPYLSNVTGTWIQPEQATDPQYWANHLCQTVRFADGIATLQQGSNSLFLEIGPGRTLSTLAQANGVEQAQTLTSLRHPYDLRSATESNHQSDRAFLLQTLGQLWLAGISVNWKAVHAPHLRYRVPLPSYPFEHQPYWIDPIKQHSRTQDITKQQTVRLQKQSDMADWFYIPSWKRSPVLPQVSSSKQLTDHSTWLIFTDDSLGQYLSTQLRKVNHTVIEVQPGHQFNQLNETLYTLRPDQKQDYNALITSLQQREIFPNSIVHLWNCHLIANVSAGDRFQHAQTFGLYSLLYLTQALIAQDDTTPVTITAVTQGIHDITGNEILQPEQATVLGLCRVISQEHSYISYRSLDLDQIHLDQIHLDQVAPDQVAPDQSNTISSRWMESLLTELIVSSADPIVAFRNGRRWTQTIEPFPLSQSVDVPQLRQGGVYLITGGLGDTSLTIAEYLAKTAQAKLVLLDHPDTPPRDEWGQGKLQNLETLGSGVLQIRADVADLEQMQAVMQQIEAQFGTLHGVVYAAETTAEQSFQPISRTTTTDCQWHFQPKAQGLLVLAQVLQGRSLDFCIVHSSIASLIGGFVAHTAANCFVDAFVQQQNRISAFPWLSINWEGWQFWQERQIASPNGVAADWALFPQEGADVFQRVLALATLPHVETSQIIISTVDLPARLTQLNRVNQKDSDTAQSNVETDYHPRPDLHTDYDAPRNDIERTIATIWQNLLGIERIGIYDSFFQLGGHSLLAVQITSRLRETFQLEIPLRSLLLDTPTIAGLAEVVAAHQSQLHEPSDLDVMAQLLAEIEGLSPVDVQAQLAQEPNTRH